MSRMKTMKERSIAVLFTTTKNNNLQQHFPSGEACPEAFREVRGVSTRAVQTHPRTRTPPPHPSNGGEFRTTHETTTNHNKPSPWGEPEGAITPTYTCIYIN